MTAHNKITFAAEYCRCRNIPYRVKREALFIKKSGAYVQLCYSLYNLTYADIITMIDGACAYDAVTTLYTDAE